MNEVNINHTITKINDTIIQGIIYNYIVEANNKNINFRISINDRIPTINSVTPFEMTRMLGIILDNAFEAVREFEEKNSRLVELNTYVYNGVIRFIVKNKCMVKPDFSKIFLNTYSTKGAERGRGLPILKKIADKHNDVFLRVKINEDYFTVELDICN